MTNKPMKVPGPEHPIDITPTKGRVTVEVNGIRIAGTGAADLGRPDRGGCWLPRGSNRRATKSAHPPGLYETGAPGLAAREQATEICSRNPTETVTQPVTHTDLNL
jgi:hypothetical protein